MKRINGIYILYDCDLFVSEKIFLDIRKTTDRLQHVNEKDVVPTKLIKSKNMGEVTTFIFEMIRNDEVDGCFDKPVDDEPRYVAQISETAGDKLKKFLFQYYPHAKMSSIRFQIKGRVELNEVTIIFLVPNVDGYQNVQQLRTIIIKSEEKFHTI